MELLFIYNENHSTLSRLIGYAHKVLKPSTYKCPLCKLTHNGLGERLMWKAFKVRAKKPMSFLYNDEFRKKFNLDYEFPVILVKNEDVFSILVDTAELNQMKDVEELISLLENKLGIKE